MTISEAIGVLHALKGEHKNPTALTAINDGISALMIIEDMRFYGILPVKKEPVSAGFDMKTLYEQTIMHCDRIQEETIENFRIETYHQPETPIYVIVYWNIHTSTIKSINYIIKGE